MGAAPIYLRVTYQKHRKNISTGFSVPLKAWENVKGRVRSSMENATQINAYITQTKSSFP
jgi:hypothetical protein